MRAVPIGWIEVKLSNENRANHSRWWCPKCVGEITRRLPNALGEFATGWPHVKADEFYCEICRSDTHDALGCNLNSVRVTPATVQQNSQENTK